MIRAPSTGRCCAPYTVVHYLLGINQAATSWIPSIYARSLNVTAWRPVCKIRDAAPLSCERGGPVRRTWHHEHKQRYVDTLLRLLVTREMGRRSFLVDIQHQPLPSHCLRTYSNEYDDDNNDNNARRPVHCIASCWSRESSTLPRAVI